MRRPPSFFFAAALSLLIPIVAQGNVRGLPELLPVDEATKQPDFFSFRAQLQAAIARRDTSAVIATLGPGVRLSFGGHGGRDQFRTMWLAPGRIEELWREMGTVLALGGTFQSPTSFAAPYVFSAWPSQGADAFEHVAVLGSSVRVRSGPRAEAPVLTRLSYAIVKVTPGQAARGPDTNDWVGVTLPDGRSGYIHRTYVRSPVDYRILFTKTTRGWVVDSFVAGD